MEKETAASLVIAAQSGNLEAMEKLLYLAYTPVSYQCHKMLCSKQDAEDITQEVLIKIYNNICSLNNPDKFSSWANSIAARHCINKLRRDPKYLQFIEDEDGNSLQDNLEEMNTQYIPSAAIDNAETTHMINELIEKLPQAQKVCTYLFYYDQFSIKEIAEMMGVSENTIKSRLNYARKSIKEGVVEYEEKQGIKLYGLSPLPFVWYFLQRSSESGINISAAKVMVDAVISNRTAFFAASAAKNIAKAAQKTKSVKIASAGSAVSKTAGVMGGFTAKMAAGIAASVIALSGLSAIVIGEIIKDNDTEPVYSPAYIEEQEHSAEPQDEINTTDETIADQQTLPELDAAVIPTYTVERSVIETGYSNAELFLETPKFEEVTPGYKAINAFFNNMHIEFLNGGNENVAEMQEKISTMNTGEYSYAYFTTFSVPGQDKKYVSVSLNHCWNVADTISYLHDDYTFNAETGELLELTDLIDASKDEIYEMIIAALTTEYGEEVMPLGRFDNIKYENFRFYVKDNKIWVFPNVSRVALDFVPLPVELE